VPNVSEEREFCRAACSGWRPRDRTHSAKGFNAVARRRRTQKPHNPLAPLDSILESFVDPDRLCQSPPRTTRPVFGASVVFVVNRFSRLEFRHKQDLKHQNVTPILRQNHLPPFVPVVQEFPIRLYALEKRLFWNRLTAVWFTQVPKEIFKRFRPWMSLTSCYSCS
jgi:hypothetical protein